MKKQWKEPKFVVQHFVPNEYVSACGTLDNGTVLYAANIEIVTAWERIPAGIHNYIQDDMLLNPHKIYRGSFYRDKEMKNGQNKSMNLVSERLDSYVHKKRVYVLH